MTVDDIIRYLEGLSSDELATFIARLREHLALPAPPTPPTFKLSGMALTGEPVADPVWDVWILAVPEKHRLLVIKALRELDPTLTLHEARRMLERVPGRVREALGHSDAREISKYLRAAGAEVEVR